MKKKWGCSKKLIYVGFYKCQCYSSFSSWMCSLSKSSWVLYVTFSIMNTCHFRKEGKLGYGQSYYDEGWQDGIYSPLAYFTPPSFSRLSINEPGYDGGPNGESQMPDETPFGKDNRIDDADLYENAYNGSECYDREGKKQSPGSKNFECLDDCNTCGNCSCLANGTLSRFGPCSGVGCGRMREALRRIKSSLPPPPPVGKKSGWVQMKKGKNELFIKEKKTLPFKISPYISAKQRFLHRSQVQIFQKRWNDRSCFKPRGRWWATRRGKLG